MIDGHVSVLPGVLDRVAESQLRCSEAYGRQPSPAGTKWPIARTYYPSNKTKRLIWRLQWAGFAHKASVSGQVSVSEGPSLFYTPLVVSSCHLLVRVFQQQRSRVSAFGHRVLNFETLPPDVAGPAQSAPYLICTCGAVATGMMRRVVHLLDDKRLCSWQHYCTSNQQRRMDGGHCLTNGNSQLKR